MPGFARDAAGIRGGTHVHICSFGDEVLDHLLLSVVRCVMDRRSPLDQRIHVQLLSEHMRYERRRGERSYLSLDQLPDVIQVTVLQTPHQLTGHLLHSPRTATPTTAAGMVRRRLAARLRGSECDVQSTANRGTHSTATDGSCSLAVSLLSLGLLFLTGSLSPSSSYPTAVLPSFPASAAAASCASSRRRTTSHGARSREGGRPPEGLE